MRRLLELGRWPWRLALIWLAVAAPPAARAGITFASIQDGSWKVFYQRDLGGSPAAVASLTGADAGAPALSPDGRWLALEVQGVGIEICPVSSRDSCRTVRPPNDSAVRPAWNPSTSELVFASYAVSASGEDSDLWATRGGLERIEPLLVQTGNQDDPDVSPDGRQLAYSSAQTVRLRQAGVWVVQHLWLMDLESGEPRQLTSGSRRDLHPDFSPTGERIAFASDRSGRFEIWVIGAAGGEPRQVTSGPGAKTWPAWSPDGKSILFNRSHEGRQTLWIVGADGTGARPYRPFGADPEVQLRDADWR